MDSKKIEENLKLLYTYCKNGIKDKSLYKFIIRDMESSIDYVESPESITNLFNQLQNWSSEENKYISKVKDTPLSKFGIWNKYLYTSIWKKLHEDGLGHLRDYYISSSLIHGTIAIYFSPIKSFDETKEEFNKRKEKNKQKLIDMGITLDKSIIPDTEDNRIILMNYIKEWLDPVSYEINSKLGKIDSIKFILNTKSHPAIDIIERKKVKKVESTNEFTELELEKMAEEIKNMYHAFNIATEVDRDADENELQNTTKSFISSAYITLCRLVGIENSFTQKDKKPKIQDNTDTINKIGKSCDIKTMQAISRTVSENIEKYMLWNYGMYLSSMKIYNEQAIVHLKFGNSLIYEGQIDIESVKKILDICEVYDEKYLVDTTKTRDTLKKIALCDFKGEIQEIRIKYIENEPYISDVFFKTVSMAGLNYIFEKYYKEEK